MRPSGRRWLIVILLLVLAHSALATTSTVVLAVEGMS